MMLSCKETTRLLSQGEDRELAAGIVDIILEHHLHAEPRVPECGHDQQRHGHRRETLAPEIGGAGMRGTEIADAAERRAH